MKADQPTLERHGPAATPPVVGKPIGARRRTVESVFPIVGRVRPMSSMELLLDRAAKVAILAILLAVIIHGLSEWSTFLVPVVAAIVLGLMLGPPMVLLERFMPAALAAFLLLSMLAAVLYLLVLFFAPPFTEWFARLPELWQELERHFNRMRFHLRMVEQVQENIREVTGDGGETPTVEVRGPGFLTAVLSIAPPALGQVVLFAASLYFYLATRTSLRESILSMCMRRSAKLRAARIIRDIESNISRYLLTITLINMGLGVATGIAMFILGMPSPALWGIIIAILNFIPYVGPWAFIILLGAIGLVTFDTLGAAMLPPVVFIVLNLIESQFVTPGVLGRRLTLNPFMIILALGFWMWMWGPVGAFLAVPLLIISVIIIAHIVPATSARR